MGKKKALKYFKPSADDGISEAQFMCGLIHYQGEGVERDYGEAQQFWELAAAQGHQGAQQNLGVLRVVLRGANVRR